MAYRTRRTTDEVLGDNILALCMLYLSREHGREGDKLKAMKMLFLAAYDMFRDQTKALNIRFYRYEKGPYSTEAQGAWEASGDAGFLIRPRTAFDQLHLTNEGVQLAREFYGDALSTGPNKAIRDCLLGVAEEYGDCRTSRIMEDVYEMRVETVEKPGEPRRIRDIQHGTFTHLIESEDAVTALDIGEGWLTTLAIEFSPRHRAGMAAAMEDLAAGRVHVVP